MDINEALDFAIRQLRWACVPTADDAADALAAHRNALQPARDVAGLIAEAEEAARKTTYGPWWSVGPRLITALRDAEAARVTAEEIKEEQRRIGVRALQAANDAQSRCNAALARAEAAEARLNNTGYNFPPGAIEMLVARDKEASR